MRLYLEAIEIVIYDVTGKYAVELIRIDVTDKDWEAELEELKAQLDPEKSYQIRLHHCYHDEMKACKVEVVE